MLTVHNHHLGHPITVGGRRKRSMHAPRLSLICYGVDFPVPDTFDFSPLASAALVQVFANDTRSCCVEAAGYHVLGVQTANAEEPWIATDDQVLGDYSKITGFIPSDPSTDRGTVIEDAIHYWTQVGFANGTKLAGSLYVDPRNSAELRAGCYLTEGLLLGVQLAKAWMRDLSTLKPGYVWDVADEPDPDGGHCPAVVGVSKDGLLVDNWGMLGTITWGAMKYADEAYALLSKAQILKGQDKAPQGFAWGDLVSDFAALGGYVGGGLYNQTRVLSLQQAQTWALQELTGWARWADPRGAVLRGLERGWKSGS